jgi:HK97 family phage major capsid protein
MSEPINEVTTALNKIKTAVDEKLADTVTKSEVAELLVETASQKDLDTVGADITALKSTVEALEAKLDAIPSTETEVKSKSMNIHQLFTKNIAAGGKAEAQLVLKNITRTNNVVGAPVDTYGLTGTMFAANPFRQLASVIETNSKALVLPVRTGSHGAAASNATTRNLTAGGSSAVAEVTVMASTIEALTEVTVEAADDIIGFDQFWSQDMLDEVGSIEAQAHVAVVEGMAGIETDAVDTVDLDDLAALHFAVEPQYRASGAFVVSTDVMKVLRTLNTSSTGGDLLFDAQLGEFRLFGRPIYENAYMAEIDGDNVVAAFGDWRKGMVIANRSTAEVARYEQTKPGYYSYRAAIRSGAAQWHAPAVKTLTVKAA